MGSSRILQDKSQPETINFFYLKLALIPVVSNCDPSNFSSFSVMVSKKGAGQDHIEAVALATWTAMIRNLQSQFKAVYNQGTSE